MLKRYAPLMLILAFASILTGCCCLFPIAHHGPVMPFPPATESPKANRDEARVKTARSYLAALVTAVDMFEIDCGRYPTQKEGLEVLFKDPGIKNWMGPYIRDEKSLNDPWGTALRYAVRQNGYTIASAGPDRKFETDDDIHLK